MKRILIAVLISPAFLFAQTQESEKGIQFEQTSFTEILAKAKKENKMVMVDAYTTWCGPCKWMVKNIFPNDTVGEFYNKNFINAKIDMEKGEGIDLAKKYNVSCYPTYLFIDGDGQMLHRVSSSMQTKEFIELGRNAMTPAKQFAVHQKKYDSGTSTADEMAEYILMRGRTCMPVKDEMAKYFATQKDADLISQRNWDLLLENSFNLDVESREFKYLAAHKGEYEKKYTQPAVEEVLKNSYRSTLSRFIKEKNMERYNSVKADLLKNNFPFGDEMALNADMILHKSAKDWKNYAAAADKLIDTYKKDDHDMLNNIAWDFYENIEDKALLARAEAWIKHSVDLKPGYYNCDTYAAVLYKLGKKSEAKAMAERAIELGKKGGEDISATQELLDKINAL